MSEKNDVSKDGRSGRKDVGQGKRLENLNILNLFVSTDISHI